MCILFKLRSINSFLSEHKFSVKFIVDKELFIKCECNKIHQFNIKKLINEIF
jgi:hypothetical protein